MSNEKSQIFQKNFKNTLPWKNGEEYLVLRCKSHSAKALYLAEAGIVRGSKLTVVFTPRKNTVAVRVKGAVLCLRKSDLLLFETVRCNRCL